MLGFIWLLCRFYVAPMLVLFGFYVGSMWFLWAVPVGVYLGVMLGFIWVLFGF